MRFLPKWFSKKSIHDMNWRESDEVAPSVENVTLRAAEAQNRNLAPVEQYELSIAVNAAVNAICRNLSKARIRLFTRTGREIVSGQLYDLLKLPHPKFSQRKLIWEIAAWLNIAGEFMINMDEENGRPAALYPLAPQTVRIVNPAKMPNRREDVVQWGCRQTDGSEMYIRDDFLLYERLFNPNPRTIRGLSPLVTGACQVSGAYYAERYNKQFFENNAIPSHIIKLSNGTPKVQRDAFTRQYLRSYGNYANNAHKVAVVTGDKDFAVEVLEQPFQDGAFMEMMKRGDLKVGQLFRVPAISMGIYDKTRFDTANEERKLFLEETLDPQAELIAEAFQFQLVDPFFQFSDFSTTGGKELKGQSKSVQKSFEKAEADRRGGKVLLLLDTDTLPIKHEIILAKTESALKMREAYHMSPQEAADFVGMDIDAKKEREDVWIANNYVNITHPEQNAALVPGVKPAGTEAAAGGADKPAKPSKKRVAAAKALLRKIRRPTFDAAERGSVWTLAEADVIGGAEMKAPIRRLRHGLRKCIAGRSGADAVEAAKTYLNGVDAETILK